MYTKTKILIFNKTGRFIQENVLFNVFNIMYKCLGIPFTASSSTAQDEQTLFISQNFEHTINQSFYMVVELGDILVHSHQSLEKKRL